MNFSVRPRETLAARRHHQTLPRPNPGHQARRWFLLFLGLALGAMARPGAAAGIVHDAAARSWSLVSGPVEYRLSERDGRVALDYFGPKGEANWRKPFVRLRDYVRFDIEGQVDGQYLRPEFLLFANATITQQADDQHVLTLTYRHRHIPLEVAVAYTVRGDTGVFTRQVTFRNQGPTDLPLEDTPTLAWLLPGSDYTLQYLHGAWGEERQLAQETLTWGKRSFGSTIGRSSDGFSPWFCLRDEQRGVRYAAQLAYSGNWEASFFRFTEQRLVPMAEQDLWVKLGLRHDFGGPARLKPGATLTLPWVAFTASTGDLNDITNQLHRFQRRYVIPKSTRDDPLLTQVNTFESLGRSPVVADLKRYTDHAVRLGIENIGPDASWIIKTPERNTNYGHWIADPDGFPNGMKELADYIRAQGLTYGVWLEPETIATTAPVADEHPEWILRHNGVPMRGTRNRVFIDFRRQDVRDWNRAVVDWLVRDIGIAWLKVDYNAEVREAFDPAGAAVRSGTVLYDHLQGLDEWLDGIRRDYPDLLLEGCASGALRFDLSMLSNTHFNWRSDVTTAKASIQLAYGATIEFAPEASYHWMSGDDQHGHLDPKAPRGWWDFAFRASMNGRFGIAARMDDWTPEMWECAQANVALYKRIRGTIKGGDTYRLTPPPAAGQDPKGWMAIQYASPDATRSVLMAYRLADSPATQTFALRGLDFARAYEVTIDGAPPTGKARKTYSGRELATIGLTVQLDDEFRAAVIELAAER